MLFVGREQELKKFDSMEHFIGELKEYIDF